MICQGRDCHNLLAPSHGRPRKWCSERCRKTKYSAPCEDCGAPLNGSDGRGANAARWCRSCAAPHGAETRRIWTQEAVVLAFQEWAAEYGDPPAVADWNPYQARNEYHDYDRARRFELATYHYPPHNAVYRAFGSWNAALVAAGFEPRVPHGGGGNQMRRRSMRAAA